MDPAQIKIVSWNVNGLNAAMKKGFADTLSDMNADIVAIQETKLQEAKLTDAMANMPGYTSHWAFSTAKKGYSGVGIYTRREPVSVTVGFGLEKYDREGRVISADYGDFILFNVYFPNGQSGDERLQYKLDFYNDFFSHTDALRKEGRRIVIVGDYNTAHNEIDLKNPKSNANTSGFMRIERDWIDRISDRGYVDTFRHLHPEKIKYSWWTYRFQARSRNIGWRIDYVFITQDMIDAGCLHSAFIDNSIMGSDHCPVGAVLTGG